MPRPPSSDTNASSTRSSAASGADTRALVIPASHGRIARVGRFNNRVACKTAGKHARGLKARAPDRRRTRIPVRCGTDRLARRPKAAPDRRVRARFQSACRSRSAIRATCRSSRTRASVAAWLAAEDSLRAPRRRILLMGTVLPTYLIGRVRRTHCHSACAQLDRQWGDPDDCPRGTSAGWSARAAACPWPSSAGSSGSRGPAGCRARGERGPRRRPDRSFPGA
jgi:hypothetical protein